MRIPRVRRTISELYASEKYVCKGFMVCTAHFEALRHHCCRNNTNVSAKVRLLIDDYLRAEHIMPVGVPEILRMPYLPPETFWLVPPA